MASQDTTAQSGKLSEVATDVKWVKKTLDEILTELRTINTRVNVVEKKQILNDQKIIEHSIILQNIQMSEKLNTEFRENLEAIITHWKTIVGIVGLSGLVSAISVLLNLLQ